MTAFTDYLPFVVDHTKIGSADITNYVVRIIGTFADLADIAHGGKSAAAFDRRPYSDTGSGGQPVTALTYYEISYVAATGFINMLVLLPTAHHSVDDPINIFIGDASLTSDGSSLTVRGSTDYKSAFDFPDGTTLSVKDYSQGSHDATNVSSTAATGPFAGGTLGGSVATDATPHEVTAPNTAAITSGNTYDLSIWVKRASSTNTGPFWCHDQSGNGILAEYTAAGTVTFNKQGVIGFSQTGVVQDTSWHKWDFQADGSGMRMYLDGNTTPFATNANTSNITVDSGLIHIGRDPANGTNFTGNLALAILRNTIRTTDQIHAEYLNESSPSTFAVVSTLVHIGGGGGTVGLNNRFIRSTYPINEFEDKTDYTNSFISASASPGVIPSTRPTRLINQFGVAIQSQIDINEFPSMFGMMLYKPHIGTTPPPPPPGNVFYRGNIGVGVKIQGS